jgi:hypothetical protein
MRALFSRGKRSHTFVLLAFADHHQQVLQAAQASKRSPCTQLFLHSSRVTLLNCSSKASSHSPSQRVERKWVIMLAALTVLTISTNAHPPPFPWVINRTDMDQVGRNFSSSGEALATLVLTGLLNRGGPNIFVHGNDLDGLFLEQWGSKLPLMHPVQPLDAMRWAMNRSLIQGKILYSTMPGVGKEPWNFFPALPAIITLCASLGAIPIMDNMTRAWQQLFDDHPVLFDARSWKDDIDGSLSMNYVVQNALPQLSNTSRRIFFAAPTAGTTFNPDMVPMRLVDFVTKHQIWWLYFRSNPLNWDDIQLRLKLKFGGGEWALSAGVDLEHMITDAHCHFPHLIPIYQAMSRCMWTHTRRLYQT